MCVGIYYCDIVLSASRIISETIIYNICLIIYNHILYIIIIIIKNIKGSYFILKSLSSVIKWADTRNSGRQISQRIFFKDFQAYEYKIVWVLFCYTLLLCKLS